MGEVGDVEGVKEGFRIFWSVFNKLYLNSWYLEVLFYLKKYRNLITAFVDLM